jgi:hypothetical protein
MTFAQIYQLNGWGQYGIQGSIVNVLISVDKMQIILPRPTTCESTIVVCIKRKIKYKSLYLSSYVRPRIVMKALHDLCDTPLYKEAKVLVRKDWVTLFESNNVLKVTDAI